MNGIKLVSILVGKGSADGEEWIDGGGAGQRVAETGKWLLLTHIMDVRILHILQVYYLQVFLALIIIGFLHGLVFLPASKSLDFGITLWKKND